MTNEDTYLTLDLGLRVGELLLSSGAGAADVSIQMQNVALACGLRGVSSSVTFTELQLTHQESPEQPPILQMRNVVQREIDYEDLTLVDQLVRDLVAGRIDRDGARAELARIVSSGHTRSRRAATLGWGVMGGGVGLMLGATPIVVLTAFVGAILIDVSTRALARRRLPVFYQQVAGGLLATVLAVLVSSTDLSDEPSRIISAGIILLLAGVSFMGAVQDALTGFPLTSMARLLEATLATAGAIAGVSGGLTLANAVGLEMPRVTPGSSIYSATPMMTIGGAVTAAAFAFASYAPLRSLLPIALVGGLASTTFALGFLGGLGVAWPSALAAVLVGLISYAIAGRVRVPTLAIVVSGVVPLLPGLAIYRGLAILSENSARGLIELVNAAVIAIALGAGVILGEYFAQPLSREARRFEQRLSGPRLVGPLTARSSRSRRHRAG
ncbi:threonine/serine ThrE exporter family protein [Flexivirga meconopsidis]|uniref:threonine/serine ThrE exporter family protein n=1 Tax=Flexivirga meconopsidis TaxID=2977121 RepID=UPI0022401072|nr:threonine/serine exporter family protein [Flexivirga meconopsidis]